MFVQSDNPNQALWEKGDFTRIAATMRESGEDLVRRIGIGSGARVLDLGSGDGTTAIPAAKAGAEVLGVDIARNLVEAGSKRAAELGLAKEMVRVTRPGGRIVMGNWIPNDPTLVAQILRISSAYTPPPPASFVSPMTWGVETNVVERFGGAGIPENRISFTRDTFTFRFTGTPPQFVDEFRNYYGPTMNAFDAAAKNGRESNLQKELEELFSAQNVGKDGTEIPATFLRVEVTC